MVNPESNVRNGGISLAVFPASEGKGYKGLVLQKSWLKKEGNPKNKDDWNRQSINMFFGELIKVKDVVNQICEKYPEEIKKAEKHAEEKEKA